MARRDQSDRIARQLREASAESRRKGRDPKPHLARISKLADEMRKR